ncbi:MAG TPA: fatty acyl-AMP ligase [Thermoleophilaceae bacterium]
MSRATEFRTFAEALAARADDAPDALAFTFLGEDGVEREAMTYGALQARSAAIAGLLEERLAPDERVLLLLPPGLDYVAALFGCFQAGVVAVSAPPPQPPRLERTLPRLLAIGADAAVRAVLTTGGLTAPPPGLVPEGHALARAPWLAVDAAREGDASASARAREPSDLAIFQYTSGSTADPRGVMLTHDNLLVNSALIAKKLGSSPADRAFVWLPPYHDMGLIGGILQPVYGGFECVLTSPLTVVKRPERWLEGVSTRRATISGGPNFSFDLCVRRIGPEARERLDLSSWEVAFNGAEPIRAGTLEAFATAFAPCGFRREAFHPCYGLAEATLMVTAGERDEPPTLLRVDARALERGRSEPVAGDGVELVGCGGPDAEHELAIVDPETLLRCEPGQIGEVWVAGPSVARGYLGHAEETARAFGARIAGEASGRRFLRTGDLGFSSDGELFVVGRIKDLLVVNGRNLHPHDVEVVAEAVDGLRPHSSAVFALGDSALGDERVGIVAEPADASAASSAGATIDAVRREVGTRLGLDLELVVLCERGSVPKTTSGKVQRRLCRSLLLRGELDIVASEGVEPGLGAAPECAATAR